MVREGLGNIVRVTTRVLVNNIILYFLDKKKQELSGQDIFGRSISHYCDNIIMLTIVKFCLTVISSEPTGAVAGV